jgi:chaperonin GroEL
MQKKEINTGLDCRSKLLNGVIKLVESVACTLGPFGRNVILEKQYGQTITTKDGVTVAKEIELEDPIENIGAQIIKEAASQTNEQAGDGTTTSTVIAHAIFENGLKILNTGNSSNSIELKRGIDKATKEVVKKLKEIAKDITSEEEIKSVALISANNDNEIGTLISEAMKSVGREGVITVEESKTAESKLEIVEGMQFQRRYLSPYFITNNELMQVQMEEPYILLYDKKISDIKDIIKLLEKIRVQDKPLLIIADDVEGQALATLVVNKARGTMKVCAVKAPEFGTRKTQMLEDLAILTGTRVMSLERGDKIDKLELEDLGKCRLVTVDDKMTTIIDGKGDKEKIEARVLELKHLVDNSTSNYDTEKLQERLGKLGGGIAVIHIGAETELEMKEKKDRVDDALHATKAAIDEGIIAGGGTVLYRIGKEFDVKNCDIELSNKDQEFGAEILYRAIQTPFERILKNAGEEHKSVWKDIELYVHTQNNDEMDINTIGYDVRSTRVVDMFVEGIIDPVKVTRVALEKASSVAGLLLTTEAVVSIKPDKNRTAGQEEYDQAYN